MTQSALKTVHLTRYTSLDRLLDILSKKKLTLLDPKRWDDKNDSYFMELYKQESKSETVLVLCFVQYSSEILSAERYHHWKVYGGNTSGVRIQFKRDKLIEHFKAALGNSFRHGLVKYKIIKKLEKDTRRLTWNDLPFIKRRAFIDEKEFRFVYQNRSEKITSKDVTIDLNSISRITCNPWMTQYDYKSTCERIREIVGHEEIELRRSTCLHYQKWQIIGKKIAAND